MDDWEGSGYDVEASSGGGLWLRLKKKGEKVRLRLCSAPYRWTDTYTEEDGTTKQRKKCAWLVIHKEMVNDKPLKSVRIFQGGPMVYGALKDLADSEEWGSPLLYDVTVERTEEPGKYYVVTPLPKPMGELSEDEKALLAAANIDWPSVCMKNRGSGSGDPGPTPPDDPDSDPFAD